MSERETETPVPHAPQLNRAAGKDYLLSVLPHLFEAPKKEFELLFEESESLEKLNRFFNDSQVQSITISRENNYFTLSLDPKYKDELESSIIVFKKQMELDPNVPINQQVSIIYYGDQSKWSNAKEFFNSMHSVISFGAMPYFQSYKKRVADEKGYPVAKRRFVELQQSLMNLQQKVQIPEPNLEVNEQITKVVHESKERNQKPKVDLVPNATCPSFLNSLQSNVNKWVREIQKVTKLERELTGQTVQEIEFWLTLELVLQNITKKLKSEEIELTLQVLKQAKRFHATMSFLSDTGIEESLKKVQKYNVLMKEFPIESFMSSATIKDLQNATLSIFVHVIKKLKLSTYPVKRMINLLEILSLDLTNQAIKILKESNLMQNDDFETITNDALELFLTWEEKIKEFCSHCRDLTRRRFEDYFPILVHSHHHELNDRIQQLRKLKLSHEQLQSTQMDFENVNFELFLKIDVLDLTLEGTKKLQNAEKTYNEQTQNAETTIINHLIKKLQNSSDANEMYLVFSKFNSLLLRPRIKGAIQDYQVVMLNSVKLDIFKIQEQLRVPYLESPICKIMTQKYNVGTEAARIIYSKQTKQQLENLVLKVKQILGPEWQSYPDGMRIQQEYDVIQSKINIDQIFQDWINKSNSSINGQIMQISKSKGKFFLESVLDSKSIQVYKNVKHLQCRGFQIPLSLVTLSRDVQYILPYYRNLVNHVKIYEQTIDEIESNLSYCVLMVDFVNEIQILIEKGISMTWECFLVDEKYPTFVLKFCSLVEILREKQKQAESSLKNVMSLVRDIKTEDIHKQRDLIQSSIGQLNLSGFNMDEFLQSLNLDIEKELHSRIKKDLQELSLEMTSNVYMELEIIISDNEIRLYPILQKARCLLYQMVQKTQVKLKRISSNSYFDTTSTDLFQKIEFYLQKARAFVNEWMEMQKLWNMDFSNLHESILEISLNRKKFDLGSFVVIGPLKIQFHNALHKLNTKFDQVQSQLCKQYHEELQQKATFLIQELSLVTFENMNNVQFVCLVHKLQMQKNNHFLTMELLKKGNLILQKRNLQLPITEIEQKLQLFEQNLQQQHLKITSKQNELQIEISNQSKQLQKQINEILDWKPPHYDADPQLSLDNITTTKQKLQSMYNLYRDQQKALEILNYETTNVNTDGLFDQLQNLENVYTLILNIWQQMQELTKILWINVTHEHTRKIQDLVQKMKKIPEPAYEYFFKKMQQISKQCFVVEVLQNEAMRPRHWLKILNFLKCFKNQRDLTLQDVFDFDLDKHQSFLRQIATTAVQEMELESCLQEMQKTWQNFRLCFKLYKQKVNLCCNTQDIFKQCGDHQAALVSMKASVHYKTFEHEAQTWLNHINLINEVFDLYIQVQQKWVHLEGLFENKDVKVLLPMESSMFFNLTQDFFYFLGQLESLSLMEIILIPLNNLKEVFKKLNLIQKALGEYLERERLKFPRFYFLGDEDLLEILGSKNVESKISKLFPGIHSFEIKNNEITKIYSPEGEQVELLNRVPITMNVNEYLEDLHKKLQETLKHLLGNCVNSFKTTDLKEWIESYPQQILVLATQVCWSQNQSLDLAKLTKIKANNEITRQKKETLIKILCHQQNAIREYSMQYKLSDKLMIQMADVEFEYGFEYFGVREYLVQTDLTDKCYLALTQALHANLGGSPFGPAGTGKTETVKALGMALGKQVFVFCCDESFDFKSMSRILMGVCKLQMWVCFDEFNRLEERILSAVSQKIQFILENKQQGIFVTMNPGYVGRNELPNNLKKLFCQVSMTNPDMQQIATIILLALNFNADLSPKICLLFSLFQHQLSKQQHYDFGLRALKSVLKNLNCDSEQEMVNALHQTIFPKLVPQDKTIFLNLLESFFPNQKYEIVLDSRIKNLCDCEFLMATEEFQIKVQQLHELQKLHHGIMLVGESGSGKSTCLKILSLMLQKKLVFVNPNVSKNMLYGSMDPTTREWTDGLFTDLCRKYKDETWIIFDGEIDPEWVENLNSVLDDNKILTLPNGERIPVLCKLFFEVDSLKFATMATVSRCGMVWFNSIVTIDMLLHSFLQKNKEYKMFLEPLIPILKDSLEFAESLDHIMHFSMIRALDSFFSLMQTSFESKSVEFIKKKFMVNLFWAFGGDLDIKNKHRFQKYLFNFFQVNVWNNNVFLPSLEWQTWKSIVSDVQCGLNSVVPTVDTVQNEHIVKSFGKSCVVLCGPPGSGKSMCLLNCFENVICLNFSSSSTCDLIINTLLAHCQMQKHSFGFILEPKQKLIVLCDEINLPEPTKYGSQPILSLLRQILQHNGFWLKTDWITLRNVQFVAACNPPTDLGRVPLPLRLLRHTPVLYVDYPEQESLIQIYQVYLKSMLPVCVSSYAEQLTKAMVYVYLKSKQDFELKQPHYIYSPRELTRWVRGILHALDNEINFEFVVFVWAHEGLRLFMDRLCFENEKQLTKECIYSVAKDCFDINLPQNLFFSNWLTNSYDLVEKSELKQFIKNKLTQFYEEEEVDNEICLFDHALQHILNIDRIFHQEQGHLLLIGSRGCGKETLCRFTSWMNNHTIITLNIHKDYTEEDFDEDLRKMLRRVFNSEKITFLIKTTLNTAFLEKMNTLIANNEIPGLFSKEELSQMVNLQSQVMKNLHVIFILNSVIAQSASPALFNRCVLDWFGDWDMDAFVKVATKRLEFLDVENPVNQVIQVHLTMQKTIFSTPRHFVDFLHHTTKIYQLKKEELEDNQRHLSNGVDKLQNTMKLVESLNLDLKQKQIFIEQKSEVANEKLQRMVAEQQEAETRKIYAMQYLDEMKHQQQEILNRKQMVDLDLARVEPAVEEAKSSVQNIKKQHLTEVRSMANPPEAVKLAMESVCAILQYQFDSWKSIQSLIRKEDFISSILNFDTKKLNNSLRKKMQLYTQNNQYQFEIVNHASKACGPLVQWVIAQVEYSEIMEKVGPLRLEVESLTQKLKETEQKHKNILETINELQQSINNYNLEYKSLMTELQVLKSSTMTVENKVSRSVNLLESLKKEQLRWNESKLNFPLNLSLLFGTCVLCAASLVYSGYFDHKQRLELLEKWKKITQIEEFDLNQQMRGTDSSMVILQNSIRSSLVLDPSMEVMKLLTQIFPKLVVTSFLSKDYKKLVVNSTAFQSYCLIQNAEFFDDFVLKFLKKNSKIILLTQTDFPSSLSSKTTIINFGMSPSSIEQLFLNRVLEKEQNTVFLKHQDIIKLQGEFKIKLFKLEQELLYSLNDSKSILEDEKLLGHLELLKQEANFIELRTIENKEVMDQLESVVDLYSPFAKTCSMLFMEITKLKNINVFYSFDLNLYSRVFFKVLNELEGFDELSRLENLKRIFFEEIYNEFSTNLQHHDKFILMLMIMKADSNYNFKNIQDLQSNFVKRFKATYNLDLSSNFVIFCAPHGLDASKTVEELASNKNLKSVAMGCLEANQEAEKAMSQAKLKNHWVLLKNVHLDLCFLNNLNPGNFKLILTTEPTQKFPINLIKKAKVFFFEPKPGMKAKLLEHLQKIQHLPNHKIYFIVCWFHCILLERCRYVPLGWTKQYEFNDADFMFAIQIVSKYSPIPWDLIRMLFKNCIYGKVDNPVDFELLCHLCDEIVNDEFECPDDFILWANNLDEDVDCLGLPEDSLAVLKNQLEQKVLKNIEKLNQKQDETKVMEITDLSFPTLNPQDPMFLFYSNEVSRAKEMNEKSLDFCLRVQSIGSGKINLMFDVPRFFAALRQVTAKTLKIPIESLFLNLEFQKPKSLVFHESKVYLESIEFTESLNLGLSKRLEKTGFFFWDQKKGGSVRVPLYAQNRQNFLDFIYFESSLTTGDLLKHGAAIFC